MRSSRSELLRICDLLLNAYGKQNWWPVDKEYHKSQGTDPREEVVIGAILTQNTSWRNVEKAISNLKENKLLSFKGILSAELEELKALIKPAGYYNQKAHRLKEVIGRIGSVDRLKSASRKELLSIKGIGDETADVLLLYAADRLSFVIDTYTKRIVKRVLGISGSYDELKTLFEENLPKDLEMYKEFHALMDEHAKRFCRKNPVCSGCPLRSLCLSVK